MILSCQSNKMSKGFNIFITVCVLLSVGLYFIEVGMGYANSLEAWRGFLWSERILAGIFTFEIFYEWKRCKGYIGSGEFWIDLIAVTPFWVGFFVPPESLGIIRTLRVLRLFKLFWTCESFQILARAIKRAWPALRSAMFCMVSICLFAAAVLFQIEPETFGNIWNSVYFSLTAGSTVGFGDLSPTTGLGKLATILLLYGPAIFLFGAVMGVTSAAYQNELENNEE